MSEEKKQYDIEFVYDNNGQPFQSGALLTPDEKDAMESVLAAYAFEGCISYQSVSLPEVVIQTFDDAVNEIIEALKNEVSDGDDLSTCQNCDTTWPTSILFEVENLSMRVSPGEVMPSGECPACGAVCHIKPKTKE